MQGGTWAAALKKGLKPEDEAAKQDLVSDASLDAIPSQSLPPLNPKAAAAQKLLSEALKSRANAITGTAILLCNRSTCSGPWTESKSGNMLTFITTATSLSPLSIIL